MTNTKAVTKTPGAAPEDGVSGVRARRAAQVTRAAVLTPFGLIGATLLCSLLLYAVLVPLIADPPTIDPLNRMHGPSLLDADSSSILGTDHLGRDLAVSVAIGVRTSLIIGFAALGLAVIFGWTVGALSGFLGGWVDPIGGRLMDLFNAFPGLLLVIAVVTALGPSTTNVILALALVNWVVFGRVTRARALSLRGMAFIEAAAMSNVTIPKQIAIHVRRNTIPTVFALAIVELPGVIIGESTLSFLGLGVRPPTLSLGSIIAEEQTTLQIHPWGVTFPGSVLALLCVGTALLGLAVRTAIDRAGSTAGEPEGETP